MILERHWLVLLSVDKCVDVADVSLMRGTDCRLVISRGAEWLLHMGSVADVTYGMLTINGGVRFTNILADMKNDPTNLFETNQQWGV
eukprot:m.144985 g.144985  ORF g.144985 m.144985 type:complete len:87 (+) comp17726_c0_seq11:933-1193(+)